MKLLIWSSVTLAVFIAARWLFVRTRFPLFHPVLVSTLTLVALVEISGRRYADYGQGTQWLGWILGPGVVAMAVPVYHSRVLILKQAGLLLAVVLAAAAALGALFGFAVFGLFGVEVLLGVAVEIAFASLGGALAWKARREGWLSAALRRTAAPAVVVLIAVMALGAAIDHWLPQARSLPHAVQLLRM